MEVRTTTADQNGEFQTMPINEQTTFWVNTPEGHDRTHTAILKLEASDYADRIVTLNLEPVHPPSPDSFPTFSGRAILRSTGEPVTGVVDFFPSGPMMSIYAENNADLNSGIKLSLGRVSKLPRTRDDGSFDVKLPYPTGGAVVTLRIYPDDPTLYQIGGVFEMDFSDGGIDDIELYFDRGCAIEGQVLDAQGNPITNIWVRCRPSEQYELALTGPDGRFQLYHLRFPDRFLTVHANNLQVSVEPIPKGTILRNFVIRPGVKQR